MMVRTRETYIDLWSLFAAIAAVAALTGVLAAIVLWWWFSV